MYYDGLDQDLFLTPALPPLAGTALTNVINENVQRPISDQSSKPMYQTDALVNQNDDSFDTAPRETEMKRLVTKNIQFVSAEL